jgi:hypothetical protein
MARAELEQQWQTVLAPEAVAQAIEQFCAERKVTVARRQPGEIEGKQGSQLTTRLLGGWFVDPATFPKRITIRYQPAGAGCQVHVRLEETMGFGFLDAHFKNRYMTCLAELMERLRHAIPPAGGQDVVVATVVEP